MPRMNGMKLLAEFKGDSAIAHIPELMLTTEARKQDIMQAASLGAAGYVVKPFTRAVLESKVLLIMRKQGRCQVVHPSSRQVGLACRSGLFDVTLWRIAP